MTGNETEWKTYTLDQLVSRVVGGGTPQRNVESYWAGNLPWASVKDFQDEKSVLEDTEEHISIAGLNNSSSTLVDPNVVVICTRMAVGRAAITTRRIAINQDLKAIYTNDLLEPRYLLYILQHKRHLFEAVAIGSTVKGITLDQLLKLSVCIPLPDEQRAIADILDTIDAAIQDAERVIAKQKAIRAGLLHDLLTYGLDANGEPRNPIAHREQFKDSPLGLIPREWEVVQLRDVVPRTEYGISVSLEDTDGIPVLRMNNLKGGEIDLSDLKYSRSMEAQTLLLQENDVLFNRTNSIEHVGRTSIWRGQLQIATFASYLVRLVPNTARLIPRYLNLWLNLPETQLLIRKYATPGVHQVNINPTNLRKVYMSLPQNVQEQTAIVTLLEQGRIEIATQEVARDKLIAKKKGLMDDLLTGRVRVGAVRLDEVLGD
jgi:type I restriction enzyme S subunit